MGLIRLLILAALIYITWRLAKRLLSAGDRRTPDIRSRSEKMIKCRQCGVHVPEGEALRHRELAFCCQEHQRLYLEKHEP